jgi:dTDP-4-dehydrorhamnose 3,5-epimerase
MKIIKTDIDGLLVIEANPFIDHRGSFTRFFCKKELSTVIEKRNIVQVNHSRTKEKGAIRGMHYQKPPYTEMKFVRCLRGRIWDVAIDLRQGSKTFLRWHAEELTPDNAKMLVIPEGFAHGFQALDENSELLYFVTEFYEPKVEGGIRYNDPRIKIEWPLDIKEISGKDQAHPFLDNNFVGVKIRKVKQ